MDLSLNDLRVDLQKLADPQKAKFYPRFFKTGKGEYGEGDKFIGVTVPNCRKIALIYQNLSFKEIEKLLKSKIHEQRLISLLILVIQFEKGNELLKQKIFDFYLSHSKFINNWDLVDLSSYKIVGAYLFNKERNILYKFVKSKNLWERRITIISTYYFIKNNQFEDTIKIAKFLLLDRHDLIQKAVGWMLREVGKKDKEILVNFLDKNCKIMPRVTLRYAIEHFPKVVRNKYLSGEI